MYDCSALIVNISFYDSWVIDLIVRLVAFFDRKEIIEVVFREENKILFQPYGVWADDIKISSILYIFKNVSESWNNILICTGEESSGQSNTVSYHSRERIKAVCILRWDNLWTENGREKEGHLEYSL